MASRELLDVAVEVLGADLVERSRVRSLEDGPERLDAVGMGLPVHVFGDRVVDRLVVRQLVVGGRFVRVGFAPSVATSPMNSCRVALSVAVTTSARTSLVSWSLTPTTAILPTGPRPVPASSLRFALLMFRRFPPM